MWQRMLPQCLGAHEMLRSSRWRRRKRKYRHHHPKSIQIENAPDGKASQQCLRDLQAAATAMIEGVKRDVDKIPTMLQLHTERHFAKRAKEAERKREVLS